MKKLYIQTLLLLLGVFIGWIALLFVYAILYPDNQAGLDRFSGTALILSCSIIAGIALINGYTRLSNRISTMRVSCEGKRQHIENEKIELEDSIHKVMDFLTFYYRESARQSSTNALMDSLSSMLLRSADSLVGTQEFLRVILADQNARSNPEVQQMIAQITGKEASIRKAKQDYNSAVSSYNALLASFPANLLQSALGAVPLDYYTENRDML
ncbi:MAG: LemA family protein [Christensenella sp.]|nr:LemA family protein [Christensenella sp.]